MKIGLFFGSFNPIHLGHLVIANYMAEHTDLDQVWLVVSPHNPLKAEKELIHVQDRLEMVYLSVNKSDKLRVSDVELRLPRPSYTIDTLIYLHEQYPQHQFNLIMGADNLKSLKKWKNYELILRDYRIYVYPRPGMEEAMNEWATTPAVIPTKAPQMDISATFIRKSVLAKKSIRYLVTDEVFEFIDKKGLYMKLSDR